MSLCFGQNTKLTKIELKGQGLRFGPFFLTAGEFYAMLFLMNQPAILRRLPDMAFALLPRVNFPDDIRTRHFAFLLNKSKIIRIGWNSYKTHPEVIKRGYPSFCKGLHAELATILSARLPSYRGLQMAVLRINWNGEIDFSKPCIHCQNVIDSVGIDKVWFTNKGNVWESL